MKTNIYQGNNISKLKWDYFLTIHQYHAYSNLRWEIMFQKIFESIPMNQLVWTIESNGKLSKGNHAHILLDSNGIIIEDELIDYFLKTMNKGRELQYSSKWNTESPGLEKYSLMYDEENKRINRLIEYHDKQMLVDMNGNHFERDIIRKDYIPFRHVVSGDNRVYLEYIKGVRNTALYSTKFTSNKINTGYIR
jgi:hypothetical protein